MIDIDTALTYYHARINQARLDTWPDVWAGHWAGERFCGELGGRVLDDVARSVFPVMVPFAFAAEVSDSVVIFDAFAGTLETAMIDGDRVLYATRLAVDGDGFRTTHWIVPYSVTETGQRMFGKPHKSPFFVPKLNQCYGTILDQRQQAAVYSFEEVVAAVMRA